MKIKTVTLNIKKKAVEITTGKGGAFSLPFVKLPKIPTTKNPIVTAFVDPELANSAVTLVYVSAEEESVHLDAFLEYNRDPSHMREITLYSMTVEAVEHLKKSGLSKHEVIRRLATSPSQLYRLLDPTNKKKTIDEMVRLLSVIGCRVEWTIVGDEAA